MRSKLIIEYSQLKRREASHNIRKLKQHYINCDNQVTQFAIKAELGRIEVFDRFIEPRQLL